MNETILNLLIGLGTPLLTGVGVWAFAKYLPKEQTFQKFFVPLANTSAIAVYSFFGTFLKLKKSDMQKVNEGFFKTLAYWSDGFIHVFIAKEDALIEEGK